MSSRQVQRESEIENLLISLMETNLETRKRAAKRLFELSNENRFIISRFFRWSEKKIFRLRQDDSKKGVKLMTADSNYEIRLLGAKVILNMARQSTTQTKESLSNPPDGRSQTRSSLLLINIKSRFLKWLFYLRQKRKI